MPYLAAWRRWQMQNSESAKSKKAIQKSLRYMMYACCGVTDGQNGDALLAQVTLRTDTSEDAL